MKKSIFKLEHFENGIKEFKTNNDFILFVQSVYVENEDWMELQEPKTIEDCVIYIRDYCDNFKMVEI